MICGLRGTRESLDGGYGDAGIAGQQDAGYTTQRGSFQPEWPEALKEPPSWGAFGVAFSPRLPAPYWVHRQSLAKIKTNPPPICRLLLSTRALRGSQVVARVISDHPKFPYDCCQMFLVFAMRPNVIAARFDEHPSG
jgi:hypothetical protein